MSYGHTAQQTPPWLGCKVWQPVGILGFLAVMLNPQLGGHGRMRSWKVQHQQVEGQHQAESGQEGTRQHGGRGLHRGRMPLGQFVV